MKVFIGICLMMFVCGCSNITKEDLGLANLSPNEKLVEQRQPLVLPDNLIDE